MEPEPYKRLSVQTVQLTAISTQVCVEKYIVFKVNVLVNVRESTMSTCPKSFWFIRPKDWDEISDVDGAGVVPFSTHINKQI